MVPSACELPPVGSQGIHHPSVEPPLSEESLSLDGLEALLMLDAPESVPVKIRVSWLGNVGAFSGGVLLGPL